MTAVDDIKNRLDIVDLVSETVKLRKAGKSFSGFCPFHPNVHTPAFVVFPNSGTWRCFGQCNEGGDIFKYVMKRDGLDFTQALHFLAERAGVTLEAFSPQQQQAKGESDQLRELLEDAVIYYRNQLLHTQAGQEALEYLHKRGLTDETITKFGLGYAPDKWDGLMQHLYQKGRTEEQLVACGLVSQRDSGGVYDKFRHRITFPIRDANGQMTGFGARIRNPEDMPKFMNSPQTMLFDKGRLLYGLDAARKSIRQMDQVVLVEGYLDVIMLHQGGFTNTVSPMGTALTEDQLHQLKKYTKRLILAMDADAAGQKATLRGLQIARDAMDRESEIQFDVHGLLRYEARLQADIRVTTIPEGMDPDEVVIRDPAEWQKILDTAKPLVIHVMDTLASDRDIQDPKVKNEIANQVIPLIEDIPSTVERDTYRQKLARLLRVSEESLPMQSAGTGKKRSNWRARKEAEVNQVKAELSENSANTNLSDPIFTMERHVLAVLFQQPALLQRLDRMLQQGNLSQLSAQDFRGSENQYLVDHLRKTFLQDEIEPQEFLIDRCNPLFLESVNTLLAVPLQEKISEDIFIADLFRTIIRIRESQVHNQINELRYFMEDDLVGETSNADYQSMMVQCTTYLNRLSKALNSLTKIY